MGGESSERASGESEGEALRVINGEMSEWLKEHAWKACVGETLPRVRIPLSPPTFALARLSGARRLQASARLTPRLGANPSLSANLRSRSYPAAPAPRGAVDRLDLPCPR